DAIALKFNEIATQYLSHDYRKRRVYRGLFPSWDNTARRKKNPLIVLDGTPDNYERWLTGASEKTVAERDPTDRLVFINAWNEWAEGCHLEADLKYGNDFLDATYRSKRGRPRPNDGFTSNTRLTKRKKRNDRMEDLRLWGHRSLRGHPVAFTVARSVYRALMKPFR
ncbi:MAG: glycoside hydrolase family 99-like domain-containing protein, partial [Afipia sp.]